MARFVHFARSAVASLILACSASGEVLAEQRERAGGERLFAARCGSCHALDRNRTGPALGGVVGRTVGAAPGFRYSPALKVSNLVWDATTLDKWLTDPSQLVPGARMSIRVRQPDERAALIAYLGAQVR